MSTLLHMTAAWVIGATLLLVAGGLALVCSDRDAYSRFAYKRAIGAIVIGIPVIVAVIYFNRV